MNSKEFNAKKKFSEASGVISFVDSRVKIKLNKLGYFEEELLDGFEGELDPLVELVSPNLNDVINESQVAYELYSNVEGIKFDKVLGYYKNLYAGHVLEGKFRKNGSSGGMTTWVIKELFEKGLINGVIHVKECKNSDSGILFEYGISTSLEEIIQGAKTRYYPVEFSKALKFVRQNPGKYAIVGIPSFIMAFRLLSRFDKDLNSRIVFCIGLICGHQKSSKLSEIFGWQVGFLPGNLKTIDFRYKFDSGLATNYGVKMIGKINGLEKTLIKPISELVGDNWSEGYFKVPASDYTDDVFNETADITLGDAWIPEYIEDSLGNNIIITRNKIIDNIIKEGIEFNKIKLNSISPEKVKMSQKGHIRHTQNELPYRLFQIDSKKNWRPKKRLIASNQLSFFRKRIQDLRLIISHKSHQIYQDAIKKNDIKVFLKGIKIYSLVYELIYFLMKLNVQNILKFFKRKFRK
jgi:coenzyme F420 hydrogenase subunit beta